MRKIKTIYYNNIDEHKLKLLVIESIAVCNYKIKNNSIIITLTRLQEDTRIILNDQHKQEFYNDLIGFNHFEVTVDFLFKTIRELSYTSLVKKLKMYKKRLLKGRELNHTYLLKLYSKTEIKSQEREKHNALWIDYEQQLKTSNTIKDSKYGLGIWSFPVKEIEKCLNKECYQNYGKQLFVLQPIKNVKYIDTGLEVIGKKYKVVKQFDVLEENILQILEKYSN